MKINIYSHSDCIDHDPGEHHPENSTRLHTIMNALKKSDLQEKLCFLSAPIASSKKVLLAHTQEHLNNIKSASPQSQRQHLDADTIMSTGSLNATLRGVGAACQAVDDLMFGHKHQAFPSECSAFCATRPPGHHATANQAMGFCLFNHVAVAALYAKKNYHLSRIAIIDFDVHHGNGTQDIISGQKGIFYISTHQSPLYPGSGNISENISNNILNIPLPANTNHENYLTAFETIALPALNAFQPELILVSAGFDAHLQDPIANLALTESTYFWLGQQLSQLAKKYCPGRLISILEGGYNSAVLGTCVLSYLQGMQD